MRNRLRERTAAWSPNRRIITLAGALAALLLIAGFVAVLAGRSETHDQAPAHPTPQASPSRAPRSPTPSTSTTSGTVPGPPPVSDPLAFARDAARMLWTYDTRTTTQQQQLAGTKTWMTPETKYADWTSVSEQVPDPLLWSRMADQDQRASAKITESHFPGAFKTALSEDPAAITQAYIYAITVSGSQTLTWSGGGSGAEERSVTLAVQCRPSQDCALVALAPTVAP
ncbi:hypothetical protein [Streptomyces sp. GZWMJZ-114]|uniref:hypothetical protein n=1 Tax=Streptomyces sp. GZWMJZ-114 TaxID=2494734 RepID=UPI0010109B20|nr:hypothetical protein [Streptomyces sp. GZWMJZ-114]